MMKLRLRRQKGMGGKGAWVRNERTGEFVRYARIVSQANSGNLELEWDLPDGTYTYQENWYGKIRRETFTVPALEPNQEKGSQ